MRRHLTVNLLFLIDPSINSKCVFKYHLSNSEITCDVGFHNYSIVGSSISIWITVFWFSICPWAYGEKKNWGGPMKNEKLEYFWISMKH